MGRTSNKKDNRSGTTVLPCSCESAYQDGLYGVGLRLHNSGGMRGQRETHKETCTICGKVRR